MSKRVHRPSLRNRHHNLLIHNLLGTRHTKIIPKHAQQSGRRVNQAFDCSPLIVVSTCVFIISPLRGLPLP